MTGWQRGLAVATGLFGAWAVLGETAERLSTGVLTTGGELSRLELGIVIVSGRLARALPFVAAPVLLAPMALLFLWTLPYARCWRVENLTLERAVLGTWLRWIHVAVLVGILTVPLAGWLRTHARTVQIILWMWVLFGGSWAYAGALYRALRVHAERSRLGLTDIDVRTVQLVAFVTSVLQPLGLFVPLWVAWRAGQDRTVK